MKRALALVLLVAAGAAAQEWPQAAEKRFDEATAAAQKGDYARAAELYHQVAEWPGGDFPQRAQALFCAGLNEKNAQDYERALATWRAVVGRFPASSFARQARLAIDQLDPPGARGIDFERRLEEAWRALPATREPPARARPALEKALRLLVPLLADHRDHPRAADVALAIADARTRLDDLGGAREACEDAVGLARREADAHPGDAKIAGNLGIAEGKLAEARRAIGRRWADRAAKALLLLVLGVLVWVRPSPSARLVRVGAWLVALDALLALAAVGLAEYVRRYVDDHSPLEDSAAALLVLGPGLAAIVAGLGIGSAARGRRGAGLAAVCAALAGAALATSIVYAYGLFPFLDSEL